MKIATGCAVLAVCAAATAGAQDGNGTDRGGFIIQLGKDTLAVERFVATPDSIVGEMVARSPTTRRSTYVAHMDATGVLTTYRIHVVQAGHQPIDVDVDFRARDSVRFTLTIGDKTQQKAGPHLTGIVVPVFEPGFATYMIGVRRALAAHRKRMPLVTYYPGGGDSYPGSLVQAAPDLVILTTKDNAVRVRIDAQGHIVGVTDPGGTLQAVVTRIPSPDIDQWQAQFVARDTQGKSFGTLSPRDTVRATVGGAHVMVDYGRPSKRGRAIFGGVIPYNVVWRTGANAATTFVVDHDMMLGDTKLPAGEYTLFSVPTADGWTLVVSKNTREWGTEYDSTADFARIPMQTASADLPVEMFTIRVEPQGADAAALAFAWDTRVGRIALRPAGS
jgi:hypothetical protein